MASSPGLSLPPPYPPPLVGEGRVGAGTVPDDRDGLDKPGHDQVGAATSSRLTAVFKAAAAPSST